MYLRHLAEGHCYHTLVPPCYQQVRNKVRSGPRRCGLWISGTRLCIAYREQYTPLITWPRPTANVNGSCPGSFVDQNFLERSLSFPYPEGDCGTKK